MDTDEIFESSIRSARDVAGVFEYDGDTGFFYLYKERSGQGREVIAAIKIFSGEPDFASTDIAIRWDKEEAKVGLFIRETLWAVFDANRNERYGGNYNRGATPELPLEIERSFGPFS